MVKSKGVLILRVNMVALGRKVTRAPVVQSIISLTSLLVDKMLSALVSTISHSQLSLLKKCE